MVLLREVGVQPKHCIFHCLYWHKQKPVSTSAAGVAVSLRRDSQLQIGDVTYHLDGREIVLEVIYRGTPIQIANVYMFAKGTAK